MDPVIDPQIGPDPWPQLVTGALPHFSRYIISSIAFQDMIVMIFALVRLGIFVIFSPALAWSLVVPSGRTKAITISRRPESSSKMGRSFELNQAEDCAAGE
jgi:hypothetical protein